VFARTATEQTDAREHRPRDCDGEPRFRDPGRFAIPSVPPSPPAAPDDLRERNRRSRLAIDAETCSGGLNERMDLALTVDSLLGIVG
jgi:hypothetical protein